MKSSLALNVISNIACCNRVSERPSISYFLSSSLLLLLSLSLSVSLFSSLKLPHPQVEHCFFIFPVESNSVTSCDGQRCLENINDKASALIM